MKKKIITAVIICGICISITSCGGKKNSDIEADISDNPANQTVISGNTEKPSVNEESGTAENENSGESSEYDDKNSENDVLKAASASKSVAVENDENLLEFKSENGYSIVYPKKYEVVPESSDIDFMIVDKSSMSSVNVSTIWEDSSIIFAVEKEGYQQLMITQDMPVNTLDLYEITKINGIDALRIQYTYNGSEFAQTFYRIDDKRTHCITYSKTHLISDETAREFEQVTNSLKNIADLD